LSSARAGGHLPQLRVFVEAMQGRSAFFAAHFIVSPPAT
jgi:hypothetical protein